MDDALPKPGDKVSWDDPWFYKGSGTVLEVQRKPHEAVLVEIESIVEARNQHWVGRKTWILAGYIKPQEE